MFAYQSMNPLITKLFTSWDRKVKTGEQCVQMFTQNKETRPIITIHF